MREGFKMATAVLVGLPALLLAYPLAVVYVARGMALEIIKWATPHEAPRDT